MLSNGESFLQFGQKVKITNGVSFLFLIDQLACPEVSKNTNIQHYSGEFASILLHRQSRQTNLSRDVFGAKSLFYYYKEGLLIASTELRFIVQVLEQKPAINENKISEYLDPNSDDEIIDRSTFFKDISRVLPGETCIIFPEGIKYQFPWSPKDYPLDSYPNPLNFFYNAFEDAVSSRIEKNKQIGANLSGGLDSSSVVSTIRQLTNSTFDTYYFDSKSPSSSEKIIAQEVAEIKKTNHHSLTQKPEVLNQLKHLSNLMASPDPMSIPAIIFLPIYEEASKNDNEILLSGHGGDNLLENGWDYLDEISNNEQELKVALSQYFKHKGIEEKEIDFEISKYLLRKNKKSPIGILRKVYSGKIKPHHLSELIYLKLTSPQNKANSIARLSKKAQNTITKIDLNDFYPKVKDPKTLRLLSNNLSTLSVQAMEGIACISKANGVTTSYPFLTKELLQITSKIPSKINFNEGMGRGILRNSMKDVLPKIVRDRKDKSNFNDYYLKVVKDLLEIKEEISPKNHKVWNYARIEVFERAKSVIFDNTIEDHQKLNVAQLCYRTLSLAIWLDIYS